MLDCRFRTRVEKHCFYIYIYIYIFRQLYIMKSLRAQFLAVFLITIVTQIVADFDERQCFLRQNRTCYQYSITRRQSMMCSVTGRIFKQCQQICNAGNCSLTCSSPETCKQQCFASLCESLSCNAKTCDQYCIRGRCNMICTSEECRQTCDVSGCEMKCPENAKRCIQKCSRGNCKMHCPAGVQYCQQICESGRCTMFCDGKECARICRKSNCIYSAQPENVTALVVESTCNRAVAHKENICYQNCIKGDCALETVKNYSMQSQGCYGGNCNMSCSAKEKCSQVCVGRKCQLITCTSDVCIQECVAGGCHMECYSRICTQICRGGNCKMGCLSSYSKLCYQTCVGGGCVTSCEGENCNPRCFGGKCRHSVYQPPGITTKATCDKISDDTCVQTCRSKTGCALANRPSNPVQISNQTCTNGFCFLNCTGSDICNQKCSGKKCYTVSCNARECVQVCNGEDCGLIECDADTCTQTCFGWGCHLKCHPSVQICNQICLAEKGRCFQECWAQECTLTLL